VIRVSDDYDDEYDYDDPVNKFFEELVKHSKDFTIKRVGKSIEGSFSAVKFGSVKTKYKVNLSAKRVRDTWDIRVVKDGVTMAVKTFDYCDGDGQYHFTTQEHYDDEEKPTFSFSVNYDYIFASWGDD